MFFSDCTLILVQEFLEKFITWMVKEFPVFMEPGVSH
jgi:hypothetical protein